MDDRLAARGRLAVVERLDRDVAPPGLPERGELARDVEDLPRNRFVARPIERGQREPRGVEPTLGREVPFEEPLGSRAVVVTAGADVQDRERLVGADDDRVRMLLEDL